MTKQEEIREGVKAINREIKMNETMSIDREGWEVCSGDIPVMEEKITCPLMKPDMFRAFIKSRGIVKGVEGLTDRSLEEYEYGETNS